MKTIDIQHIICVTLCTLTILLIVPESCRGYGQTLQDCKAVAAFFNNTCNRPNFSNPPELIDDMLSETVYCPDWNPSQGSPLCIGTTIDDVCTWERKLCVTCDVVDQVTMIRIQTNNMPNHCVNSGQVKPQNFDFEVAFNYPLTYGDWVKEMLIQPIINVNVCSIVKNTPDEYVELIRLNELTDFSQESENAMGFMINGVALQFANQMQEDPVYPLSVFNEQPLDVCIGHNQRDNPSGMYHYHDISPCIIEGFMDNRTMGECNDDIDCNAGIVNYQLSGYEDFKYKTVVGIAKDGHVLYGPYRDDGMTWEPDDVDTCNGAWTDDLEEFFYPGTRWHPYGPGCLGSSNFAHVDLDLTAQCSTNGLDPYINPTTPPAPCDNDFSLTLLTDEYGSETSWTVTDSDGSIVLSGDSYDDSLYYTVDECLPTSDCYTFTIFDSFGDGICCDVGEGQYSVEYNGDIIANGGDFEDSEVTTFGTDCLTGSTMPSSIGTPSPTEFPTPAPTKFPKKSPTKSPTSSPTEFPTPAPTDFPTPSPTDFPTPAPTKFPKKLPTKSPTSSPTDFPTPSPTKSPTPSPTSPPSTSFFPTDPPTSSPTITCGDPNWSMSISGNSLSCGFVASTASACLCDDPGIASYCKTTCNSCAEYGCVDSPLSFIIPSSGQVVSCGILSNLDPVDVAGYCAQVVDLRYICPDVCGVCSGQSQGTSQTPFQDKIPFPNIFGHNIFP